MQDATREIFWLIPDSRFFYVTVLIAMLLLLAGLARNVRFIRGGAAPDVRVLRRRGTGSTLIEILTHRTFGARDASRWWHLLVFYGIAGLFLVTCCLMLAHYGPKRLYQGTAYLILTGIADLAGAALLLGSVAGLVACLRKQEESGLTGKRTERAIVFFMLSVLCLSGFLLEGLRIHLQKDPWFLWNLFGTAASRIFSSVSQDKGIRLYRLLWWLHGIVALVFLAWIPFSSRLRHLLFLPVHRSLTPLEPRCAAPFTDLQQVRIDNADPERVRLGIGRPTETTPMQRLAMLSCMDCGRCDDLCPAFLAGQPLSPRTCLQDLRTCVLVSEKRGNKIHATAAPGEPRPTEAVSAQALWSCRLCLACEEQCPAGIEHTAQILELRRSDVLDFGKLPSEGSATLRHLARTGNPYGASPAERSSWIQKQGLSLGQKENEKALLLWTGCFMPGDEQKPEVLTRLVNLLKVLGIPVFALQSDLSCCGDPARILGEEDLFQSVAREQIQQFRTSGADRVLVHCPHCYTVLKDVYPLLGAEFPVIHTSEFFLDLFLKNQLNLREAPYRNPVVYHDPCFLARYQAITDPPRQILRALPGIEMEEPEHNRNKALCCGAGGGHFFMDLDEGERPANLRMKEILTHSPGTIAVSCSFCFSMFDDALRRTSDPVSVRIADWLELLEESVVQET